MTRAINNKTKLNNSVSVTDFGAVGDVVTEVRRLHAQRHTTPAGKVAA